MSTRPTDPLLLAGRILTLIMQGIMVLGGIALSIAAPVMLIFQDKISAHLVEEYGQKAADFPAFQIAVIMALGVIAFVLAFRFFGKLRRIIETVEEGDPFVPDNADRLTGMAWHLTAIYALLGVMGITAITIASYVAMLGDGESSFAVGVDLSMILTIIILFILARVFRKGTEMRDDLEGTV